MPSANQRLLRNSPSIFTSLFSQFNLLAISSFAVNSMGDLVSLCMPAITVSIARRMVGRDCRADHGMWRGSLWEVFLEKQHLELVVIRGS